MAVLLPFTTFTTLISVIGSGCRRWDVVIRGRLKQFFVRLVAGKASAVAVTAGRVECDLRYQAAVLIELADLGRIDRPSGGWAGLRHVFRERPRHWRSGWAYGTARNRSPTRCEMCYSDWPLPGSGSLCRLSGSALAFSSRCWTTPLCGSWQTTQSITSCLPLGRCP